MTTDDDLPDPPIAEQIEKAARETVVHVVTALKGAGWDYAVVSIAKRIDIGPTRAIAPGATGMEVNKGRMGPALGNEADALRTLAKQLDEMCRAFTPSGTRVDGSYVQDMSNYASGRKEWPR